MITSFKLTPEHSSDRSLYKVMRLCNLVAYFWWTTCNVLISPWRWWHFCNIALVDQTIKHQTSGIYMWNRQKKSQYIFVK